MTRPSFLFPWLLTVVGLSAGVRAQDDEAPPPPKAAGSPNLVLILTDDQSHDLLNASGRYPFLRDHLPHLDRLMREGLTFSNTFVTTSLCSPSRASILTGMYAHRHLVYDNLLQRDPDPALPTFPQLLQQVGYQTAFVGKWHMLRGDSPRPGFDEWYAFRGQGKYRDPRINHNGDRKQRPGYVTDLLTDHAVEWIQGRAPEQPFFLYLSHKAVHADFEPPERHQALFEEVLAEFKRTGRTEGLGFFQPVDPSEKYLYHEYHVNLLLNLCRTLVAVDESLGRVRAALEEKGLWQDTVLMFTSDNGYLMGEGGEVRGKRVMMDASIRVPLVVWPGPYAAQGPGVVEDMILNVDFAPTFLDLAEHPSPPGFHGRSFADAIRGKALEDWRTDFFYEYFTKDRPVKADILGVRTLDHSLVRRPSEPGQPVQLFDVRKDPEERDDLADVEAHAELRARLEGRLDQWMQDTGFTLPDGAGR